MVKYNGKQKQKKEKYIIIMKLTRENRRFNVQKKTHKNLQ